MFKANTTWEIKMSKGDTAQFPLFINKGTRVKPVRYEFEPNDGCEVYFYLMNINAPFGHYLLKKTFTTDGRIITEKCDEVDIESEGHVNINDNKDIVIRLDESDTIDLYPGEYRYQVKAKIRTKNINNTNLVLDHSSEYLTLTVTNKYNFYLLDDNENRAW